MFPTLESNFSEKTQKFLKKIRILESKFLALQNSAKLVFVANFNFKTESVRY